MRRFLSTGPFPLGPFSDLRTWLTPLKYGAEPIEPERLLAVAEVVERAESARRGLKEAADRCPALLSDVPEFSALPPLAASIRRSLDPDGRLADTASSKLQGVRRSLRRLREEVRATLESRMSGWSEILQEPLVLIRRDRYVIPVKPGFRRTLKGLILDQSASGQTLYVEPLLIQSENDRMAELRVEETAETYRILKEWTDRIFDGRDSLGTLVGWLVDLDVGLSMARFAEQFDCVEPEMNDAGVLRMSGARHPLIERQKGRRRTVPLDVRLEGEERQLVISGANTGGKTIALKTVGLLAMLAHAGCPVPAAEGTEIPYLDRIFADIGDEQSLAESLSTFSARLAHHVSFLEMATERSLILMDELGAGTDPAEGAALGVAVLETLASKRAWVIVTTHQEALKTYADETPAALNAAVEFDRRRFLPTFRLISGIAGTSYALAVAERLGMPKVVVERARDLTRGTDPGVRARGDRLEAREERLQALEEKSKADRAALEAARAEVSEARGLLSGRRERFEAKAQRFLHDARLKVLDLERAIRAAGRAAREALPEMKDRARKSVAALERSRDDVLAGAPPAEAEKAERRPVRAGDLVRSRSMGWRGVVGEEKNARGEWCVATGGKRAWLAEGDLVILGRAEDFPDDSGGRDAGVTFERHAESREDSGGASGFELHLLGQRVEEALRRVEQCLDDAAISGLPFVRIIHGKGTGALKRAVAEALEGNPLVKNFFPAAREAGGEGVTVVEMAGDPSPARL